LINETLVNPHCFLAFFYYLFFEFFIRFGNHRKEILDSIENCQRHSEGDRETKRQRDKDAERTEMQRDRERDELKDGDEGAIT
jgi:hypothetical protein